MKNEFSKSENEVLSEIYRRLNYFHNGDLNTNLLYLAFPSEAKKIAAYGLIQVHGKETPKVLNWYNLTDKGKKFFSNYVTKSKLSEETNHDIFTGKYIKIFDKNILEATPPKIKTVSDLAKEHPEMYDYNYKWRDTKEPETEKDIEEILYDLGYQLKKEDRSIAGEYNDIKGYYNCEITAL